MDYWETFWMCVASLAVIALLTTFTVALWMPHEFEGYYLYNGDIYIQRPWTIDEKACDFTDTRWAEILENNLHIRKEN